VSMRLLLIEVSRTALLLLTAEPARMLRTP